jgi:hypothetical protein
MLKAYLKAPERFFTWVSSSLTRNITLGWKGYPGTSTLAYHEHSQNMSVKILVKLDPGRNVTKPFIAVIYKCSK